MTVTLTFDGTKEPDKTHFKLLLLAARSRGGAPAEGQKLSKADRRADSLIKQALYAVSDPIASEIVKAPEAGAPDVRDRQLKADTVTLELAGPEFERLRGFFDSEHMVWGLDHSDFAEECSQRLSAAHAAGSRQES